MGEDTESSNRKECAGKISKISEPKISFLFFFFFSSTPSPQHSHLCSKPIMERPQGHVLKGRKFAYAGRAGLNCYAQFFQNVYGEATEPGSGQVCTLVTNDLETLGHQAGCRAGGGVISVPATSSVLTLPCVLRFSSKKINRRQHLSKGVPGGASGQEAACQCRRHKRHGFDPWVEKIPWRRE